MKTKKFNKKLDLNKKTIANLNANEMRKIPAGIDTDATCDPSCGVSCGGTCPYNSCISECICLSPPCP